MMAKRRHMKEKNINETTISILYPFLNNYKKRIHFRELSRLSNLDTKTLQRQVKTLEMFNIVKYKFSGRHKEFYLNLENLITRDFLILAEIMKTIKFLVRNFEIRKICQEINIDSCIVLFGSYAKEKADENSDIDLFVIGNRINKKIIEKIQKIYGKKISQKVVSEKSFQKLFKEKNPLIMEILDNHIILNKFDFFINLIWKYG